MADKKAYFAEMAKNINRNSPDPFGGFRAISMKELYEKDYPQLPFVVEGLLGAGLYLICGASKVGKSFFVLQLGYDVAAGNDFLNMKTCGGKVLYFALEDTEKRVRDRLYKTVGGDATENYMITTRSKTVDEGLTDDIVRYVTAHPGTRLVIIDTLQAARGSKKESSYANDYEIIRKLKSVADDNGICILLVHHTRKQKSKDPFDKINGTTGIMGAADGVIMLVKKNRTDNSASLFVTGRDIQDTKIIIAKKNNNPRWEFVGIDNELWKPERDELFDTLSSKLSENGGSFEGTATQLAEFIGTKMTASALATKIKIQSEDLRKGYGIGYESARNHNGRSIKLWFTGEETVGFRKNFDSALEAFRDGRDSRDGEIDTGDEEDYCDGDDTDCA